MDMKIEPKSDQLNYDDVMAAPVTVTVSAVEVGTSEQPVNVCLQEFPGRPFKPSKSMRRVLVSAWGSDATAYVGRSLKLYGDPTVKFGGQEVGGIRISHMSHLSQPVTIPLTVSRGKRSPFTVSPLVTVANAAGWLMEATSLPELQKAWKGVQSHGFGAVADLVALKDERKAELTEVKPDA